MIFMQKCVQFLKILILFFYFNEVFGLNFLKSKEKKGIHIHRLESCGRSADPPYLWDEVRIDNLDSGITSIYSRGECTRNLTKFFMTMDVQRCATKEALDTCQPFSKLKPVDTCTFIGMKGMAWTSFVESFKPEIKCPMKKAIYVCENATFDPNYAFFFPIDNWYWKIKMKVFDGPEYLYVCLDFQSFKLKINN